MNKSKIKKSRGGTKTNLLFHELSIKSIMFHEIFCPTKLIIIIIIIITTAGRKILSVKNESVSNNLDSFINDAEVC